MPKLTFNNTEFDLEKYETVLECLLRNHQYIPYACKAGMCQACLVRAVDCEATEESKKWIKSSLQERGYTLACQWVPEEDVQVALPSVTEFSVPLGIREITPLNKRTLKLVLDVRDKSLMFHYTPGQYVTLVNPKGIARSYSVANNYELDQHLEFHISETKQGLFSGWLFHDAKEGDELHMRGPSGDCFYSNSSGEEFPIILAGTGTGLAPLYAILNDALKQGHQGDISLYHGGRTSDHLYRVKELQALQEKHPRFHYFPCAREPGGDTGISGIQAGSVKEILDEKLDLGTLSKTRVYLCGAPDFVHGMRKKIFLKGASSGNIFCDPFLERSVAPTGGTN